MRGIIVDYRQTNPRDQVFLRHGHPFDDFAKTISKEIHQVEPDHTPIELVGSYQNQKNTLWDIELLRTVRSLKTGHGGVLVISPLRGPVCKNRIRRVLQAASETNDTIVLSGHLMERNRHPGWVQKTSSNNSLKKGFAWRWRISTVQDMDLSSVLYPDIIKQLDKKKALGSQWLSKLQILDAAVTYLPEQILMGSKPESLSRLPLFVEPEPSRLHILHRLPIFQFSKTKSMEPVI
jgi:hypothetical protein